MKVVRAMLAAWVLSAAPAAAQDFSALARLDTEGSVAEDVRRRLEVTLFLSQSVPYRVFTLDDPARVVLDFKEVDFRSFNATTFDQSDKVSGARAGPLRPGWSRMILDLAEPLEVRFAGMQVSESDGTATVELVMQSTSAEAFAAAAGAPDDPDWVFALADQPAPEKPADGPLVVVVDPGHGGIDSGAEYDGIEEADVMLALALEVTAALGRLEGIQPALTRSGDVFVPLRERLTLARGAGADLFISLHADALTGEQATGATVYTLTDQAQSAASQRIAERHNSVDVLAGVDLRGQGDEVAMILQDLARVETTAASDRFASTLVQAMGDTGAPLNTRPRREAAIQVLTAADFPSVLIEAGFLSNVADRERLLTPQGRAPLVAAITLAVGRWVIDEQALAPLIRQ